ncbi:MAG: hypothetical protein PHS54_02190 [Clostridia bacterium]|nr:hypothetical protein [Clostridia bacterium]
MILKMGPFIREQRKYANRFLHELKKRDVNDFFKSVENNGTIRFAGNDGPVETSMKEFYTKSRKKIQKMADKVTYSIGERLNKAELAKLTALVGTGTKERSASIQK